MGVTNEQIHICNWIGFGFGLFSLVCSLITLALIFKMDKNNGYLRLIASTTVFQILYDVNYVLGVDYSVPSCIAWHFLDILGGLSVAIWTNIVSFIILYVVANIKSVDIFRNYKYFLMISAIPPLILAILTVSVEGVLVVTDDDSTEHCGYGSSTLALFVSNIYYWGRLLSIVINYLVFLFISWRLQLMAIVAPDTSTRSIVNSPHSSVSSASTTPSLPPTTSKDHQSMAIYTLVSRMKYYPLVQALCRSGAAWNEFNGYKYDSFASFVMASVCSPSTGACYFAVFLIMQPNALNILTSYFSCCPREKNPEDSLSDNPLHLSQDSMCTMDEAALEYIINEDSSDGSRRFYARSFASTSSMSDVSARQTLQRNTTLNRETNVSRPSVNTLQSGSTVSVMHRGSAIPITAPPNLTEDGVIATPFNSI